MTNGNVSKYLYEMFIYFYFLKFPMKNNPVTKIIGLFMKGEHIIIDKVNIEHQCFVFSPNSVGDLWND